MTAYQYMMGSNAAASMSLGLYDRIFFCVVRSTRRSCLNFVLILFYFFFFSSRRRHTRYIGDWSSDVCSSDLVLMTSATNGHPRKSVTSFRPIRQCDVDRCPKQGSSRNLKMCSSTVAATFSFPTKITAFMSCASSAVPVNGLTSHTRFDESDGAARSRPTAHT